MKKFIFYFIAAFLLVSPNIVNSIDIPVSEIERYASSVWRDVRPPSLRLPAAQSVFPAQAEPAFPLALRGDIEAIVSAPSTRLTITVIKQEFNQQSGSDALSLNVVDSFDKTVTAAIFGDDGDREASGETGPVVSETKTLTLPEPGVYRLRTVAGRDQRYFIEAEAPAFALPSNLELYSPDQTAQLYFFAPPQPFEIRLRAPDSSGVGQRVGLIGSTGEEIDSTEINSTGSDAVLRATPTQAEAGSLWRLSMQRAALAIDGDDVGFWFAREDQAYPFASLDELLQPRTLEMTGQPGAPVPFRFRIENPGLSPLTVSLEADAVGGTPVSITSSASGPLTVAGASHAYVTFFASTSGSASGSSEFEITLGDESGVPLIRAKANLRLKREPAAPLGPRYVFFDQAGLEAIRMRAQGGVWQSIADSAIRFADNIVRDGFDVADEEGGWTGQYICDGVGDGDDDPNDGDGAPLIYNPSQPHVHICSTDGRIYVGERYDAGWRGHYHYDLSNRIRGLGYAYAVEPRPEYARAARDLLYDYATRYETWPLDDFRGNNSSFAARIITETLGESIWMHRVVSAYAMLRHDPAFSDADRVHIEENLIRPAAEVIRSNPMGTSNWQAWHNAAVGLSGYVLGDLDMIEWALRGPNGLQFLKDNAIREDGLWFEGSVGYHYFALLPLHLLMEAGEAHGEELYDETIRLAHASILDLVYPDGRFPDLNDTANNNVISRDLLYEHANAHYDDPAFDEILSFIYDDLGYGRGDFETLFFGAEYDRRPFRRGPALKEFMGNAILRSGGESLDSMSALMDFGPHGQFHGHLDKLHVSLFGQGNAWLPDLGAGGSNLPTFDGWFRRTIGHNAVLMGERGQNEDSESERPIGFFAPQIDSLQVMRSTFAQPVYPQGSVERTAIQSGNDYLVLIDDVAGGPAPYDFVFHTFGGFVAGDDFTPWPGAAQWQDSTNGYQFLEAPRLAAGASADGILRADREGMTSIVARHGFGFTDDCESLTEWSGNIGLSPDATQGASSLSWIVVPRGFQSMTKRFEVVDPSAAQPDRLTFDYKIEAATFSEFALSMNGLVEGRRAHFSIARPDTIAIDQWQSAELDLTTPDFTVSDPLRERRLNFTISGAEGFEGFYRIRIDNIQTWRSGEAHPAETRGVQLLFPGGEPTGYILAQGPSTGPPRTHPVLVVRREGGGTVRHIAVAEPFIHQSQVNRVSHVDENTIEIESNSRIDRLEFERNADVYALLREPVGERPVPLEAFAVNRDAWETDWFRVSSTMPVERFEAALTYDGWRIEYDASESLSLSLALPLDVFADPGPVLLNGELYVNYELEDEAGLLWMDLQELPSERHVLNVMPGSSTRVLNWELY